MYHFWNLHLQCPLDSSTIADHHCLLWEQSSSYRFSSSFFFVFLFLCLQFLKFYFIVFTLTHMCIHCFSHLPQTPASGQNLFCSFVLQFWGWRENIRHNKKAFLLVWDKDREIPGTASLCMCIATHVGSFPPDLFNTS
jgi:hypothetical protein